MTVSKGALEKKYSYLDQLSTEDLETILRTAALSEEADDLDLVDHILEVIVQREKKQNDALEIKRARADFDELYRSLDEPLYSTNEHEQANQELQSPYGAGADRANSVYRSEPEVSEDQIPEIADHKFKQKKNRTIINRLVIAALIAVLLAATLIPVSGYANVIQMAIAYWTDDYFSFAPEHRNPGVRTQEAVQTVPNGFEYLRDFALEHSIADMMIPQYIPDGFQVADVVLTEFDLTNGFEFCIFYEKDNEHININIIKNGEYPRTVYEKDRGKVFVSQLNGHEYHIFNNNGEMISTLYFSSIEYAFETTLSEYELRQIVESMHYI